MSKYHVNPTTGDAGKCTAKVRCPFGGEEVHYSTAEDARKAYEAVQAATLTASLQRRSPSPTQPFPNVFPAFGEPGNERADFAGLSFHLETVMQWMPPTAPPDEHDSMKLMRLEQDYEQAAATWLRLHNAEQGYGISQSEVPVLERAQDTMERLGAHLGRPDSSACVRALSDIEARDIFAYAEKELEAIEKTYPEAVMKRGGLAGIASAYTRQRQLNIVRNRLEEAAGLYRHARPKDEAGYLQKRLEVNRVEMLELEAEAAQVLPTPDSARQLVDWRKAWEPKLDDLAFRRGVLNKERQSIEEDLQALA